MSHNTKLWILVAILTVLFVLSMVGKPILAQGYPVPDYRPGPYNPEPYRGPGFERGYEDYRYGGGPNWAPQARNRGYPDENPGYYGRPFPRTQWQWIRPPYGR